MNLKQILRNKTKQKKTFYTILNTVLIQKVFPYIFFQYAVIE